MIKLSDSAIAAHPLYSLLTSPPTHANMIFHKQSFINGIALPTGLRESVPKYDTIEVIYAYGTVVNDSFVPCPVGDPLHTDLDLSPGDVIVGMPNEIAENQKRQAARNVRAAGVVPNPTKPWEAISVPSKKKDDYRICDLDAYFASSQPLLNGTVV